MSILFLNKANLNRVATAWWNSSTNSQWKWYLASLDAIKTKLCYPKQTKSKNNASSNYCKIYFDSKDTDFIEMSQTSCRRFQIKNHLKIYLSLHYKKTKTCNHKNFTLLFEIKAFLKDNAILTCKYQNAFL